LDRNPHDVRVPNFQFAHSPLPQFPMGAYHKHLSCAITYDAMYIIHVRTLIFRLMGIQELEICQQESLLKLHLTGVGVTKNE